MKGFMIYESPFMGSHYVRAVEVKETDYTFETSITEDATVTLSGYFSKSSQAKCSKKDTYDFETGALIALMGMCGVDKVVRACNEAFSEDTFKTYATKYERELNELKKDSDKVIDELIEENKKLREENVDLECRKTCNETTIELLYNTINTLSDIDDKYKEIKKENEKLKLDCEKLQHGYNDMIFCGGRQNGKQHTALVNMFKKINQKKVDAAYKEAYNTTLPVWQKEALNQMYGVYKESKEKTELPRTLDINGTTYLKSFQIIKHNDQVPTKREEMWAEIFALHKENDVIIKVKKEDINTFLHEIENKIPEITWNSCVKIFETKYTIGDIYFELKTCDAIYFRLHKRNKLSYTSDSHIYQYRELKSIDYLPPMRWDLFKKGRKIVRITPENLDDFMTKCSNNLGCIIKPAYKYDTHVFIMISDYHYDNKPTLHIMSPEDLVRNQHENSKKYSDKKIVDWEDVR